MGGTGRTGGTDERPHLPHTEAAARAAGLGDANGWQHRPGRGTRTPLPTWARPQGGRCASFRTCGYRRAALRWIPLSFTCHLAQYRVILCGRAILRDTRVPAEQN